MMLTGCNRNNWQVKASPRHSPDANSGQIRQSCPTCPLGQAVSIKERRLKFSLANVAKYCSKLLIWGFAASAIAAPLPRIAAYPAPTGGVAGVFRNTATNAIFVPHGYNYIKLAFNVGTCVTGLDNGFHVTFNDGLYSPTAATAALAQMQYDGFNVVRVFISETDSTECGGFPNYSISGPRNSTNLWPQYVANFIDFLQKAKSHNIYVIPVLSTVPRNATFIPLIEAAPNDIEGNNRQYLHMGWRNAKIAYAQAIVQKVKDVNSGELLSTIFSWELQNEIAADRTKKPFSLTTGSVTTADGVTYNMAIPSQRQQALDSNLVEWSNAVAAAIRAIDPAAMVSASVFTYKAVGMPYPQGIPQYGSGPGQVLDAREPARPDSLRGFSTLSYTDIHMYSSGSSYNMYNDLYSSEFWSMNRTTKPFLLGEFGQFKSAWPNQQQGAMAMGQFRDLAYQYGFAGSLFWTWDANQQSFYNSADPVINGVPQGWVNGVLAFPKY